MTAEREAAHEIELRLVQTIQQLPGALAAAVWLADPKRVRAVHITAAPTASGVILANAAARVLRLQGLQYDMDQVRVVFRDEPAGLSGEPAPAAVAARFLLLHDFSLTRSGSRVSCAVEVSRGEDRFHGEAVELDTEAGRARAAARATLAAAERAGDRLALGLEATAILDMFGRKYIAASVEAAVDRRFAVLAGLVHVDPSRSPEEAACLAALRAIDRWIAW